MTAHHSSPLRSTWTDSSSPSSLRPITSRPSTGAASRSRFRSTNGMSGTRIATTTSTASKASRAGVSVVVAGPVLAAGAGVLASALCMDKVMFKELMSHSRIPQVDYRAVRSEELAADRGPVLKPPCKAQRDLPVSGYLRHRAPFPLRFLAPHSIVAL